MSLKPALHPKLYAVPPSDNGAPLKKRGRAEIRAARNAEARVKDAIDRAANVLDRLEARAEEFARQMALLEQRKRAALQRAERIKEEIIERMDAANVSFAPGVERHFKCSPNPVSVKVLDEKLIPAEFMRTPKAPAAAPDKRAIAAALEAGKPVAGCQLVQNISLKWS